MTRFRQRARASITFAFSRKRNLEYDESLDFGRNDQLVVVFGAWKVQACNVVLDVSNAVHDSRQVKHVSVRLKEIFSGRAVGV